MLRFTTLLQPPSTSEKRASLKYSIFFAFDYGFTSFLSVFPPFPFWKRLNGNFIRQKYVEKKKKNGKKLTGWIGGARRFSENSSGTRARNCVAFVLKKKKKNPVSNIVAFGYRAHNSHIMSNCVTSHTRNGAYYVLSSCAAALYTKYHKVSCSNTVFPCVSYNMACEVTIRK